MFFELDDDKILNVLKNGTGLSAEPANNIIDKRLHQMVLNKKLYSQSSAMDYGCLWFVVLQVSSRYIN